MSTIFEWEGKLDATHELDWLTRQYTEHLHDDHDWSIPRAEAVTVRDGGWQLPSADGVTQPWVAINGPDVIRLLDGKKIRVTIEEVSS